MKKPAASTLLPVPATPSSPPAPPVPAVVGEIERFLEQLVGSLAPTEPASTRGRPRVLPSLCLWGGLLVCVLRGFSSQLALWRLLNGWGLWSYPRLPISDQAVYTRLEAEGTAPFERLFRHLSEILAERLAPYTASAAKTLAPFARAVVVLDETTLDQVARTLPLLRKIPDGDTRLVPGKLAGIFDLRRQQWQYLEHVVDPRENEKIAAWNLLERLERGTLVLADLGYFGFGWFDGLTDRKLWWVSRVRARTSYTVRHVFYQRDGIFDGLVWLGAFRADRAAHAVRLVRFAVGGRSYEYLTNVRDPRLLPLHQIAGLYARRWDIELAFKLIKQHLGLHLVWSAKPVVVLQQVWAVLCIAQILQALRLEAAGRAGVDPFEVSLPLLVEYLPRFAQDGHDPLEWLVTYGRQAGFIRPSRRLAHQAPVIPEDALVDPPPDLELVRPARYRPPEKGHRRAAQHPGAPVACN